MSASLTGTRDARRLGAACVLALAVSACNSDAPTGPSGQTDPSRAVFITSDIPNFWAAFDAGASNTAFQTQYLNRASAGFSDFSRSRNVTASSLAQMVRAFPRYFADIRPFTLQLANNEALQSRMREGYGRMKQLYPAAVFPPVTFFIGRFATGGTTSGNGMLIGIEFYALGPNTPVDELGQFQRDNVRPLDTLPVIVAHEHVHILQTRANGIMSRPNRTLLEQTLLEGGADFVGELVSGGNINARLREFGIPRESALWAEFRTAMNGTDVSQWLYNQGTATSSRP